MNTYLKKFNDLQEKDTFRGQQWFGERQHLVEEFSWAVPTDDVIRYIAEFDDVLEIGAGSGYWSALVQDIDGSITPIDIEVPDNTFTHVTQAPARDYFDVMESSSVLMVWPPYDEPLASSVAKQRPNHILYVGEQRGGCTADDEFFDIMEKEYGVVGKLEIPSYAGIHDNFFHYARKV